MPPTLLFAIVLGLVHAFEADHLAAVSTLVMRSNGTKKASLLGAFWGAGHTVTLLLVGSVLLVSKVVMPDTVSALLEYGVALMLLVLGTVAIIKARKDKIHIHSHTHTPGAQQHIHIHSHRETSLHEHPHSSFFVGTLHGLAGSGALSLVALASTSTLTEGLLFMLSFGLGSMIGMAALCGGIGFLMERTSRFTSIRTGLQVASGIFSIVIAFMMLDIDTMLMNVLV